MNRLAISQDERIESSSVEDLQALVHQMIGEPFQFFQVSYGDEVRLHLGDLAPVTSPRLKAQSRGSFIVGTRASAWLIESSADASPGRSHPLWQPTMDVREILQPGIIQPGSVVAGAEVRPTDVGYSLRVNFSDGAAFVILPLADSPENEDEDEEEDEGDRQAISDWEMLTPHARILECGPGPRWSYLDTSRPA